MSNRTNPTAEPDTADGSSNNTAAIIIGLAVALIALAAICCALVYKIKMAKLRLVYDQQESGLHVNRKSVEWTVYYYLYISWCRTVDEDLLHCSTSIFC